MNMKLGEILQLNNLLKTIIDDTTLKIDVLLKFKLLGIMKSIEPHVVNFDVIRNEKINEYGEKADDGSASISPNNKEAYKKFNDDMSKIIDSVVNVNFVNKLKPEDVFNKGLPADYLIGLYPIIKE